MEIGRSAIRDGRSDLALQERRRWDRVESGRAADPRDRGRQARFTPQTACQSLIDVVLNDLFSASHQYRMLAFPK